MNSSEFVRWSLAGLLIVVAAFAASPVQAAGNHLMRNESEHTRSLFSQSVGEEDLKAFLPALQKAIASDDRRKVASMIRYPIVVWVRGRDVLFRTPASLIVSYEAGGVTGYQVLNRVGNRHTVQYSDSGGGTLSTSAIVEFTVETRTLKKDGKLKSVRVLRVLEITHE